MDNNSQQQTQIHQNISFHQSSKNNDLNGGQSTQSEHDNFINISQKTNEQSSLIEMNTKNQNTSKSTKSELNNTEINSSQKTGEQSSLIEINDEDQNTEYNTKLVNPLKHNKIFKILSYVFFCILLACLIYSMVNNQTIDQKVRASDEAGQITNRMLTLIRGKYNKSFLPDFFKNYFDNTFQKKQSIVDLKFDTVENKFVIIKENKGEKDLFEKEYTALEILKDTNITLDLVSTMQSDQKLEQIAGKTNLYQLKQKLKDPYTFGLLYFKMLDKLNKMHEKGIAHSDIKPQHIVLSFENEPFFIDFGASISISDESQIKNYLHHFTPEFNLQVYFEIFNQTENIYKSIKFSSKEQVKLCDMTQLSLTFLYLLCDYDYQLNLFFSKEYNELLENLNDNNDKMISDQQFNSKQIVLHNISRILNQADPKINVINEGKDQQFLNDESYVQDVLDRQNDVYYKNNIYSVKNINKFSILFIYHYDQLGYNLEIIPQNIFITILLGMKEYEFISKKYKINEYFQDLENSEIYLNDENLFNLFEYVKIYDIKRLNIEAEFDTIKFLDKLYSTKLKDTLDELKIKFHFSSHTTCYLKQALFHMPHFQLLDCKLSELSLMSCRIIRDTGKSLLIPDINLRMKLSYLNKLLVRDFKFFKDTYQINEMYININYNFYAEEKYLGEFKKEIEQINQEQKYYLNIYINQPFVSGDNTKTEQFITETLNINDARQTILIKFKDYTFNDLLMWQQIKNILENKNNFNIQILIIKGKFNKQVAQMLQEIQLISDKVKYKFEDEYIQNTQDGYFCKEHFQKDENNKELESQYFSVNVKQCSQPQSEQILNIVFYKQYNINTSHNQNNTEITQKHKNKSEKLQKKSQYLNKKLEKQKDLYEYKSINDLKELKIQYEQQIYIQNFKFMNRKVEIEDNIKDIDFITKQIQNENHYSEIKILNQFNKKIDFVFKDQKSTDIEIYLDSADLDKLSQFKQLYLAISNSYEKFQLKEKIWDSPVFYNDIKVNQTIKYQSYNIQQRINYQTYYYSNYYNKENKEKIFCFLAQNSNKLYQTIKKRDRFSFKDAFDQPYNETKYEQDKQNQNDAKFLLLSWFIELEDKTLYKNNQTDQIRDIFSNKIFKDNIEHFENQSIINSLLPTQILKNQILLQIDFESQYIGDNSFNILFNEIEKQFPQSKMYNFVDCGLTELTIHNIFETVKTQQLENKLYFDLSKNKMSFNEFKQFINKSQSDDQLQNYIFQISYKILELKQDLTNSFEDVTEIKESDFPFLQDVEKTSSTQIENKKIKIILEFNHYIDRQSISECSRHNFFSQTRQEYGINDLMQTRQIYMKDKKIDSMEDTKLNNNDHIMNNQSLSNENTNSTKNLEQLEFNNLKELIEPNLQYQ